MKKKIIAVLLMLVLMLTTYTNAYAFDLFRLDIYETAYKLSKENDIDLPFINFFEKSANYDVPVKHSGMTFAEDVIDVDDKLEGVHFIFAKDMLTVKGEIEHGLIYGKNVVIEGKISDDTVIIAETVKILENATIDRDILVIAGKVESTGTIKGNFIISATDAIINGKVEKDLRVTSETLTIDESDIKGKVEVLVREGFDTTKIKEKYPEANIELKSKEENKVNILEVIIKGIKAVLVYTFVAMLITKKEKGITTKVSARFIDNSTFGLIMAAVVLLLSPIIVGILIALGIFGLGIITWPLVIIFVAAMLLSFVLGQLVVGVFVYEILRKKINKYKLPILAGIFAVVFALTQVPGINTYVIAALSMISLGMLITYIFKKAKASEFIEFTETKKVKIEEKKNDAEEEIKEEKTKKDNNKK